MHRTWLLSFASSLVLLAACGGDDVRTVQPYDRAPVPAVPDHTEAIDPATIAGDGSLTANIADGDYWAEAIAVGSGRPFIMFDVSQARFGDEFGVDGYEVIAEPHGTLQVLWDDLQSVTVVSATKQNYAVPGAELASLIGGNSPSAGAPADFAYSTFPFLITVRQGRIVDAHQIWVP